MTPIAAASSGWCRQPTLNADRIVFSSEGDLWTLTIPEPGTPAVAYRLTSGDGIEGNPVLSPDGTRIAFAAQYEGNTDVYTMPIDGGDPKRLTFHPGDDIPLTWKPDGSAIHFRSARSQPTGRPELWSVSPLGGAPKRGAFGECSMLSLSSTGSRFAFTPWSNERWYWKNYRGGAAPDIWMGDEAAETFVRLTDDPANDMFPMWIGGRIFFLSDRSGDFNIHSVSLRGDDAKQHTQFAANADNTTAIDGYRLKWPSADTQRRGTRIVFCQGGDLALLDIASNEVRRLNVRLTGDRASRRTRVEPVTDSISEIALSRDGQTMLIGARGEYIALDVISETTTQLTGTSGAREWGATFANGNNIVFVSDQPGEQQIAMMPADGSSGPGLVTHDREAWLFPPRISVDGRWIAFADHTMRLHVIDMQPIVVRQVDRAEAGEITDYRFSPDANWLAYVKPELNGMQRVYIHSLRTNRSFPVSDAQSNATEPRWDPAGRYLYFISSTNFNARLGDLDFEHIFTETGTITAVSLAADTPPPLTEIASEAGVDLEAWTEEPMEIGLMPSPEEIASMVEEGFMTEEEAAEIGVAIADGTALEAILVDTDGIESRHALLPLPPANYTGLEAIPGGVMVVASPTPGLFDEEWPPAALPSGNGQLIRYRPIDDEHEVVAEGVDAYTMTAFGELVAFPVEDGIAMLSPGNGGDPYLFDISHLTVRTNVAEEWAQIFAEAWRLQRDFFWNPNYGGVDWDAMRVKYEALLPRAGTREEVNLIIADMVSELATSHAYVWGGDAHRRQQPEEVGVGLLGIDTKQGRNGVVIKRIIPGAEWHPLLASPLAPAHLGIEPGNVITAVNGKPVTFATNLLEHLGGAADQWITLSIAPDDTRSLPRDVRVRTLPDESKLRYIDWVERNRAYVAEQSDGRLGYIHLPDMDAEGISMFARQFYHQARMPGLVIDVRDNGGGFVSQMLIDRLRRTVLGYQQPRHGMAERYPMRAPIAHMAAIIDHRAGSDGDIFPASFRRAGLGPLIGTRTWGGVVGIRADKPSIDQGITTQPEYAWWDADGWSIEGKGVAPDIEVGLSPADRVAGRDPQLDRTIEYLIKQLEAEPKGDAPTPAFP